MEKNNNDIKTYSAEDIARYWQGKMSSQEMHALEAAAMDDPFLADAMEGYSAMKPAVVTADVQELRERLAAREKDDKKVIPFKWWRVAAILIFLGGAGALTYWMMQQNNTPNEMAKADHQFINKDTAVVLRADTLTASSFATVDSTTKQGDDKLTTSYSYHLTTKASKSGSAATPVIVPDLTEYKVKDTAARELAKQERDDKAESTNVAYDQADRLITPSATTQERRYSNLATFNNFSGRVVDQRNNAIPFASVRVNNNANQAATTNADGYFNIKSPDSVLTLSFNSVGFTPRQLTLRYNQPENNIILDEMRDKKMSEVVVTKRKSAKASDLKVYTMDAQPAIGWDEYNKYIEANKRVPAENITGEVIVSFWVNKRGKLSDLTIEQSLGKEQDAEAIRLVKEGPEWKLLKGKKTRARVIVTF